MSSKGSELDLIGGSFFDDCLPRGKRYLYKYFTTELQRQFIRYFYLFGDTIRFAEHTGWRCSRRMEKKLKAKYRCLEEALNTARSDFDFETVAEIESGHFKCGA